jgi:hypothetical protein
MSSCQICVIKSRGILWYFREPCIRASIVNISLFCRKKYPRKEIVGQVIMRYSKLLIQKKKHKCYLYYITRSVSSHETCRDHFVPSRIFFILLYQYSLWQIAMYYFPYILVHSFLLPLNFYPNYNCCHRICKNNGQFVRPHGYCHLSDTVVSHHTNFNRRKPTTAEPTAQLPASVTVTSLREPY